MEDYFDLGAWLDQREEEEKAGKGAEKAETKTECVAKGPRKGSRAEAALEKIRKRKEAEAKECVSSVPPPSGEKAGDDSAGRVAAVTKTRTVAGLAPNAEQERILKMVEGRPKVLVIGAGAGSGKTTQLKMVEQSVSGIIQYTAYNRPLVDESKAKFKKAQCNTTHSLAFRAVGRLYSHRLGGDRMRSGQVARILGIGDLCVELTGQVDGEGKTKTKTLTAEFLAGQVLAAVDQFCQSADREIGKGHFRYIDGIDTPTASGKRGHENNDRVKSVLIPYCRKAWDDIVNVDGTLPFKHDYYVKIWQLGEGASRPTISANYILLDEAQDTAPVFLDILERQRHACLILVGDENQQIYEWRGAVNAMGAFPDAPRGMLSQSYRFGQAVADVANAILSTLEVPTDLVMKGHPEVPSRVGVCEYPRCLLYRTNAGAVGEVMKAIGAGKKPHLIGGGADVVSFCEAAIDLQSGRKTRHPELCCFDDWNEVVVYSQTAEGEDLKLMVKLIKSFTAEAIRDALKNMPAEKDADLVVSTAHKSKGREWDSVKLGGDFPTADRMADSDRRLLYVAATRAKLTLDISECPPFCGGDSTRWGEGGRESVWVPGIPIAYTNPMLTEEGQAAILARKAETAECVSTKTQPLSPREEVRAEKESPEVVRERTAGKFTWARYNDGWCVRGPAGVKEGDQVKVERKGGGVSTVTVGKAVQKYDDAWIYEVE